MTSTIDFRTDFLDSDDEANPLDEVPGQQSLTLTDSSSASSSIRGIASSLSPVTNAATAALPTPEPLTPEQAESVTADEIKRILGKKGRAKLCNVKISEAETNKLARKGNEHTRLESIYGIPVRKIPCDALSSFHSRWRSVPHSLKKKKALCDGIVKLYTDLLEGKFKVDAEGNLIVEESPEANRHVVNKMRYINVLFSPLIRPILETKGRALNKDELTEGIKQDEPLHRQIITEYNTDDDHNEDFWSIPGYRANPELDGKPITWEQSKKIMAELTKEYEFAFGNWKQSGNHDDFRNYIGSNFYLQYLWEYDHHYPGFLNKITGRLEDNVYRESIPNAEAVSKAKAASAKKKRKRGSKKKSDYSDDEDDETKFLHQESLVMKTKMYVQMTKDSTINQRKELIETQTVLSNRIKNETNSMFALLQEAAKKSDININDAKSDYIEYKQKGPSFNVASFFSDTSTDIDDNDIIFHQMMSLEKSIIEAEALNEETTKELQRLRDSMDNDEDKENAPSNVTEIE